jgi:hypothetical protein
VISKPRFVDAISSSSAVVPASTTRLTGSGPQLFGVGNPWPVSGSDGTGDATVTFAPIVHVAPAGEACTVVYNDNDSQQYTITVDVGQTYAPTAAAGAPSYLLGAAAQFTVAENNYQAAGGGFSAATAGNCTSPTAIGATQNGLIYSVVYAATVTGKGRCSLTVTDVYGQVASSAVTTTLPATYICSSQPYGTDLGVDPNGVQEDYSSGVACTSPPTEPPIIKPPTTPPTATPTPPIVVVTDPPPCTLDSLGYCSTGPTDSVGSTPCIQVEGFHTLDVYPQVQTFTVYHGGTKLGNYVETEILAPVLFPPNPEAITLCLNKGYTWNPGNPAGIYGDPDLP